MVTDAAANPPAKLFRFRIEKPPSIDISPVRNSIQPAKIKSDLKDLPNSLSFVVRFRIWFNQPPTPNKFRNEGILKKFPKPPAAPSKNKVNAIVLSQRINIVNIPIIILLI